MTTKTAHETTKKAKKSVAPRAKGLAADVRESAKAGQHAAGRALHEFRRTVDEALPDVVEPIRTQIVDAAIELADQLVTAQYKFHRSIVRSAERTLKRSGSGANNSRRSD